ncbi:blue-sensitive opsin-like [Chelonus insularis]|uniref:blue-sensitive opsin-like n=1 Tax=Chelonus insularis TaxID=460826 RepID=UPI00158E04A4|nr:blue-sensitive opsin-like [Chelonus insularis]
MSNDSLTLEEKNHAGYLAVTVILSFIGLFGVVFNLTVIVVISVDSKMRRTPINVILVNLAIGDFLVALLGDPLALISAYHGGWYWNHEACVWYAWLMCTLGLVSIGHLTVMAIERWFLVVKPMYTLTFKSTMILVCCIWVYALSLSLPPLIGWGSYGPEAANVSCSVRWEVRDTNHTDTYIAFLFFFGLIMPVIIITSAYADIICTLKKVKKRIGTSRRRERRVTIMVALMIIAFLIAWTPYAIFAIAVQYFYYHPTGLITIIPSLLAKTSICYNPIIYAGLNTQFPRSLKKILGVKDSTFSTTTKCPDTNAVALRSINTDDKE